MGYLRERVSYIRGLAEGMQLSETTNEGKLLKAILEVLDDVVLSVEDIEDQQEQLSEQVDTIDEDLAEIEKIIFDEEDYEEDDFCDDEETCYAEIECPYCNEKIHIDSSMLDDEEDSIQCPNCHKEIEIEWDCECETCKDHDHEH